MNTENNTMSEALLDILNQFNTEWNNLSLTKSTKDIAYTDFTSADVFEKIIIAQSFTHHNLKLIFDKQVKKTFHSHFGLIKEYVQKIQDEVPDTLLDDLARVLRNKTQVINLRAYELFTHKEFVNLFDSEEYKLETDIYSINANEAHGTRVLIHINDTNHDVYSIAVPISIFFKSGDEFNAMLDKDYQKIMNVLQADIKKQKAEDKKIQKQIEKEMNQAEYELYLQLKAKYEK